MVSDKPGTVQEEKKDEVDFDSDILVEAKNFEIFLAGLDAFVRIQKEAISKKDFKEACATQDVTSEFMINNIKYAVDFNNYLGGCNKYQDLLSKINQDRMNNKDGCEGKNVFYKK